MALFDQSMFNNSTYNGNMGGGLLGRLAAALQQHAEAQSQPPGQPPMAPQVGPTTANGAQGTMGGVPFPIMGGDPNAALPPNAQPTQAQPMPGQQPMQSPQAAPGTPLFAGMGAGGNLMAGFQGFANARSPMQALGNLFGGLVTGQRTDPIGMQQQMMGATYNALKSSGVPEPTARAAALNPKILEAISSNFGPPKTVDYTNPQTGIKGTAVFDPANRVYNDIVSGKPISQSQPNYSPTSSPYMAGPVPPGVDPTKWRQDQAKEISTQEQKMREQGEGSLEFLPDALRVLGRVQGPMGKDAIGPWDGSSTMNGWVRPVLGAIPGDPFGSHKALGDFNTLGADITRLSSTGLKAQYGARPTNTEVNMNKQTFGGLQSADQTTAANIIKERIANSYANLDRNIKHGFIKPEAVPPEVAQYGVSNGMLDKSMFPAAQNAPNAGATGTPKSTQSAPVQTAINPKTGQRIMLKGGQWVPMQ